MVLKTIPVCEKCWIERNTTQVLEFGTVLQVVKVPMFVMDGQSETCGHCGAITIVGIYSREHVREERSNEKIPLAKLPKTNKYKKIHPLEYDLKTLRGLA